MDSEISKIWEEALRYASPLPVPEQTVTLTDSPEMSRKPVDCQTANNDINHLDTLQPSAQTSQPLSISSFNINPDNTVNQPVMAVSITNVDGALDNETSLIETLFAEKVNGDIENMKYSAMGREVPVMSSKNVTEINSAGELRMSVTEPTAQVLPETLFRNSTPSLTEQILQLTRQQAISLDQTDQSDCKGVSNALAAGLKMIQQGNELIAKALKLSNTKTDNDLMHSYASLSPISMPSSVESGSLNIPNEPASDTTEDFPVRGEIAKAIVLLTNDNFVSSPGNFSDLLDKEKDDSNAEDSYITDANTGEPKIKRKRRREKNPNPMPCTPILPPCRVCDEKSSGFHYGANTCEACKGFFRRTLKKEEVKFQCKCREEEKLAWKRGPVKTICPACRYQRCLLVGMSKNAIKIGRYTLNRKTENIREVKSLEAMDSLIEKAICSSVNSNSSSTLQSPSTGSVISSPESLSISENSANTESPYCMIATDSISSSSQRNDMTVAEIQTIVQGITAAHKVSQMHDPTLVNRPKEVVNQIHKKYLEGYNLKEKVFGNMKPLSKEEYKEFFKVTGIDIDGRQQALEEGLQHFTKKIVQFVEYAKTIPGFSDLSTQDQASLIKYSRPEHVILAGYRTMIENVSPDLQVCTTPWGKEVHLKDMGKIIPRDMLITRFGYAKRLYDIGLTIEEEAILRAIVITFSDRCELDDPEMVQEIQYKLITCLEYLTSVRQVNGRKIFYQVLDMLVRFRNFSEEEYKVTKEMVFDWPCMSSYTLLRELFF